MSKRGSTRFCSRPAAEPPHKRNAILSLAKDRIEMLRLAIGGHSGLQISTIEIDRVA